MATRRRAAPPRFGTLRDLVIGASFVLGDGTVGRSGGKVVKNVAGFDIAKLLTGSLGTLAVITELAFRLHPLPAAATSSGEIEPNAAARGLAAAAASGSRRRRSRSSGRPATAR